MNNVIDKKAYFETYIILKNLDLLDELPEEVRTQIISNGDSKGDFSFDEDIPLFEQIDNEKTKILLSYLYLKYINKNEEEKNILLEKYKQNEIRLQKEINEKYSVDNLFKKDDGINETIEKTENTELVEYKKANVFKRLFDKIKVFIIEKKGKK